jgi:hypothetical protein
MADVTEIRVEKPRRPVCCKPEVLAACCEPAAKDECCGTDVSPPTCACTG